MKAIDKNRLNEIDTIRLLELKRLIQNPWRGTQPTIDQPDVYGIITDTFMNKLNQFDTLEKAGFLLKLVKKENPSMRIGLEIKNPCDNDNIILNTKKLANVGLRQSTKESV